MVGHCLKDSVGRVRRASGSGRWVTLADIDDCWGDLAIDGAVAQTDPGRVSETACHGEDVDPKQASLTAPRQVMHGLGRIDGGRSIELAAGRRRRWRRWHRRLRVTWSTVWADELCASARPVSMTVTGSQSTRR